VLDDLFFFATFFFFICKSPYAPLWTEQTGGAVACFHEGLLCWESGVAGVSFVDFATLCGVFPNYMLLCMGI
jgi:hypothetical protein